MWQKMVRGTIRSIFFNTNIFSEEKKKLYYIEWIFSLSIYVVGYSPPKQKNQRSQDLVDDVKRIEYHSGYLSALARAIRWGLRVDDPLYTEKYIFFFFALHYIIFCHVTNI